MRFAPHHQIHSTRICIFKINNLSHAWCFGNFQRTCKLHERLATPQLLSLESMLEWASMNFKNKRMNFYEEYKKVLLRERKRHTARRVVSTPSIVLTGYPPGRVPPLSWPGEGVPYLDTPRQGTPPAAPGRVPPPAAPGRVPPKVSAPYSGKCCKALWDMGTPPGVCPMAFWEMLQSIMGYGYPPRCLSHGILGNVAKHYGIWVPPPVWTN